MGPSPHNVPLLSLMVVVTAMLAACSRTGGGSSESAIPLYRDFLTLEVSIEDDPNGEDVQIVHPQGISADATGNIYLADEYWVSVFGPDGTLLRRIGGEGSGPGEFTGAAGVQVGPAGHIAAIDVLWDVNIYAPDGGFLRRSRYRNEKPIRDYLQERGFTFTMLNEVVALDPEHLLIDLHAQDMKRSGTFVSTSQLLYAAPDTVVELCRYVDHGQIRTGASQTRGVELQGSLLWTLLDGEHVLYTETRADRLMHGHHSRYRLIVFDLATLSADTLTVPWESRPLPAKIRNADSLYVAVVDRSYEIHPVAQEIMAGTEYFPALKALRSDQGIAFGFHYSPADTVLHLLDEDLESVPHVADIVHVATGRLLARAVFPFLPEVIRDGRAYRLFEPPDGYPAVYVYHIDRKLYAPGGGSD